MMKAMLNMIASTIDIITALRESVGLLITEATLSRALDNLLPPT
jgi:hypothetical protein